ncbi:hypothetical protein K493DRAFT_324721 [Basidiobolus meristosporus CBS 931.73]|uniref:ATP synthase subunit 4 n=1 Tax=Basidiobolus meristosporus CBS 931.73 TaxID=1314790 RepID=A0A1Y1YA95_9FUNG|nr:hypothetical protein K493DRAFT_324721 [Basidiobolus meristosporus CBS 931.73]|eukprot:ORX94898.1 hypothetical protein K493DRAFT_324721 [Basidiobolus meristosporus CBS 931.73]
MALRFTTRTAPALRNLALTSSVLGRRSATSALVRNYSTAKEVEPQQKAQSIIDALPGNSFISKTGYITVGAGIITWAISKEIYVFNEETLVLGSFIGIVTYLLKIMKQPYNEWAEGHINRVRDILVQAREDHKVSVNERVNEVNQLQDIVDVTKNLFVMSKEMARLEAEAFELKQKAAVSSEIKSVLDSWVRYENTVREREQKDLAQSVIESVKAQLADPKTQDEILAQCLTDVQKIAARA